MDMTIGRHAESKGWLRRKVLGIPLAWLVVLAFAGTAIALFIVRGGVQGSVSGGSFAVTLNHVDDDTTSVCTVSQAGQQISVQWSGAVQGDTCRIRAWYMTPASNSGTLRLQRFVGPAGLSHVMEAATCGRQFPAGDPNPILAETTLTFDGTQASITFDPNLHGFEFVRDGDFKTEDCDPAA